MWISVKVLISLFGFSLPYCLATVEPIELPKDLEDDLDICMTTSNLTYYSGEVVFWTAMQQYVSKFIEQRPSMTREEIIFFSTTVQSSMGVIQQYYASGRRFKRQVQAQPRIRKEIRSMTLNERTRYFNALNALKNDRRLTPNVYDVLASMHSGENIARAHFGPAFPGWHRLYLYLVESFLRLHDPDVTIPFWASVLDNDMRDSTQSVVFSDAFFGPGVGEPTSGPFRGWRQANPSTVFTRNVGGGGELYTHQGIQNILQRTRNRQILIPTADPDANFELQHGGPHSYVGGTMNTLQQAAYDPIFFSHHAFVDQIWERFRYRSRNAGVDTQTDFPFDANDQRFRPQHNPDAITGFFPNNEVNIDFIQRTGYSDVFYQLVMYEEVPACPGCNGSPYLFCNRNLTPARCTSRTVQELRLSDPSLISEPPGLSVTGAQVNIRVPRDLFMATQVHNITEICPKRPIINDISVRVPRPKPSISSALSGDWAYVPVKIINKRPDDFKGFEQYSLFDDDYHGIPGGFMHSRGSRPSRECDELDDAVGKIKIVSYGLNYNGYAEEYVLVDNRLGVSESTGYIPVRRPFQGSPSAVMVAAFDQCGRVCRPYCNSDTTGQMIQNEPFTGGLKVTTDTPLQFGGTYAEAMLNVWNIPSQQSCPTLIDNRIPVSFYCEYSDEWVWGKSVHNRAHQFAQIIDPITTGLQTFQAKGSLMGGTHVGAASVSHLGGNTFDMHSGVSQLSHGGIQSNNAHIGLANIRDGIENTSGSRSQIAAMGFPSAANSHSHGQSQDRGSHFIGGFH